MRILSTDLDETLLQKDKTASAKNVDAIHRALDAGAVICLNTGRALDGARYFLQMMDLQRENCYIISANGALIYDAGKDEIIKLFPFPADVIPQVFAMAKERDLYCQVFEARDLLVPGDTEESRFYISRAHMTHRVVPSLPDGILTDVIKCLVINLHDKAKLEGYRDAFLARHPDAPVSIFFSNDHYLEVCGAGVTKGSSLAWLCDHLQIPLAEAAAVGDEENDIPMLEAAGMGFAVANATAEAKAAADVVLAETYEQDAIAAIIDGYFFR